jgi:pimeloyl-ACP methyl ester carboxylesterase
MTITRATNNDGFLRRGVGAMTVRRFQHQAGDIDWYCEQRGDGPPVVLVPSGEGDCASFDKVAAQLANDFSVLTFDAPGFSRSLVRTADDVSVSKLADQIACLVESFKIPPATFYGCSSGGFAVLDLVVRHGDVVRKRRRS